MLLAAAFTHLLVQSSCKCLSLAISRSPLCGTDGGFAPWERSSAGAKAISQASPQGKLPQTNLWTNVT